MSALDAPPTGTVTFLFTDIQGSTALWEAHPDAMRSALARHDALLRRAVEQNSGYVFKATGDGIQVAFISAPEAVAAALAAQRALQAEPWSREAPVSVRMALHTGACEERGGDYFGLPLSRLSSLTAAGHGGQTLLSDATQGLVRDALPPEASFRDLGAHRLTDLGSPEHVFQLLHPALSCDFPPLRSLGNPILANNLPQQTTSFIGRDQEITAVTALMQKSRLVTLVGSGGAGKTRLSLQVAADLLDGDGDGTWLVELAPLSEPALVPQAVAQVLGIKEQAGQPTVCTLVDALKTKQLLLVLDNCEHLLPACAALASDILRACPDIHILASSREALNIPGEQTYRIPSLSLPDPQRPQTAQTVSQYEAVILFLQRAQAVQPSFIVTEANAPEVAQVCRRLDGIPLAIELAAARVRSLTVAQIMARLDDQFRLLTGGNRTALPRQQTLRALIDWSYDLLTEGEKTLLGRLSVFAGGWTLSAAETVCSEMGVDDFEVLDLLTSLVDKSLVVYEPLVVYEAGAGSAGRYRLLETVRQYARDRLAEGSASEAAGGRHAAWSLALAEQAEPQLTGPEQAAWMGRLEMEHDNLRAGLSWYRQQANGAASNLRFSGALGWFWSVRGHFTEGRQWLEQALEQAGEPNGTESRKDLAVRAKAFHWSGTLASRQGDDAVARALIEAGLTIYRRIGNRRGITYSLGSLGLIASGQGDYAAAQSLLGESLTLWRRLGDQAGTAAALNCLGLVAFLQADYAAARTLSAESLTIRRRLGDQRGMAHSLINLGNTASGQGDYAAAQSLLEESLMLFRELADRWGIAESLESMGGVAHGQNRSSRAAWLFGAAAALRETIRIPLAPAEQEVIDKRVASVRERLGAEAFNAAWEEGEAMTLEQAVEYALAAK